MLKVLFALTIMLLLIVFSIRRSRTLRKRGAPLLDEKRTQEAQHAAMTHAVMQQVQQHFNRHD
jgi:hypothetical protein